MTKSAPAILVIDDELGMREGCRRVLAAEGYEVETAEDGLAGLELFKQRRCFAAALVDLKMPRMGGLELVEKLRELDEEVLLLVITAYATIDTAVEATKRGAYGYLPKPFTPDELLLAVRNGLEMRALSIEAKQLREEKEKRLLEVAFERSKCSTIINCMTDGVIVVNRDSQIVLRNASAARIAPDCAGLPLPAPLASLPCGELRDIVAETLRASAGPVIVSREIVLGESTYMVNASAVLEPGGEMLGAVALLRDITPLKKLDVAKSMFVSLVAHEVKRPLGIIESNLELILSGLTRENPRKDLDMMQKAMNRARSLRAMVSELMDLTAIETGRFRIERSPQDVCEVVKQAVENLTQEARDKEIELTVTCDPNAACARALADRGAISRVFTNLVDNAVKYTPRGGSVSVRVDRSGPYLNVTVQDNGIGMTPEDKERAFEEFFRARNESTAGEPGSGLGLTLVKRIVDMHQGRIALQTEPGEGSRFVVSLPMLEVEEGCSS